MQSQKLAKLLLKYENNISAFCEVIKKNNLSFLLPSIQKSLEKISRQKTEHSLEKIISPYQLKKETVQEIKDKYSIVNPEQVQDKKIIAGFKIYTKDKIVDASLNTILKNFNK